MSHHPTRADYLDHIRNIYQDFLSRYDQELDKWRAGIDPDSFFGYSPPQFPIQCAAVEALLFQVEDDQRYAQYARNRLLAYGDLRTHYPANYASTRDEYAEGFPAIPSFFTMIPYLATYEQIKDSGCVSDADATAIEGMVADSMPAMFRFPEWGAHNRAMLRAAALAMAARAFPANPEAERWRRMAAILANDSIGKWSIEDSSLYYPVWLLALITYADAAGVAGFFQQPLTKYYFDFFVSLLAPSGGLAAFGDSWWNSSLAWIAACLERGAREYGSGAMRFAAGNLLEALREQRGEQDGIVAGYLLTWAYRWSDDSIEPEAPTPLTRECLDDLFGKKVIFRTGWERESTFLLLNYKPDTDYGYTPREYLKSTISVESEKAHHGHADENAICLLMHGGAVLLADGGYREQIPNGKYRSDIYHNRLVLRKGRPKGHGDVQEFITDDGHYRYTETEKIDFACFEEVEMSRTRVHDIARGCQWDRLVIHLPLIESFVLLDAVRLAPDGEAGPRTLVNQYFTQRRPEAGAGFFDVSEIDQMDGIPLTVAPPGRPRWRMRISFPRAGEEGYWEGEYQTMRNRQEERAVYQAWAGDLRRGSGRVFTTLLQPHHDDKPPRVQQALFLPSDRPGKAAGIELHTSSGRVVVGVKLSLEDDTLPENVRPRYSWSSGATAYGPIYTDARFIYVRESAGRVSYAFTEATRLLFGGKELFSAGEATFPAQPGGGRRTGAPRWRAWEDKAVRI